MITPQYTTRLFVMIVAMTFVWLGLPTAHAQTSGIAIHIFGSSKCHLCGEASAYLRAVAEREGAAVLWHDSDESPREARLMRAVAAELKVTVDGYPFIVVGRRAHLGWKGATTGLIVTNELAQVRAAGDEDVVARLDATLPAVPDIQTPTRHQTFEKTLLIGIVALLSVVGLIAAVQRRRTIIKT